MTAQDQPVAPERNLRDRKKEKAELRKQILKERNALSREQRRIWDGQIFKELVKYDEESPCTVYLCYANYKSEVDTKDFICWCLDTGKTVFVPKVLKKEPAEMEFYRISAWEELKAGYQGIPEPEALPERAFSRWLKETEKGRRISPVKSSSEKITGKKRTPIIRMLLPGAVFDMKGNRIGYGGGFYDRWLAKQLGKCVDYDRNLELIGLAYRMQVVEALSVEDFDRKADYVITEEGRILKEEGKQDESGIVM